MEGVDVAGSLQKIKDRPNRSVQLHKNPKFQTAVLNGMLKGYTIKELAKKFERKLRPEWFRLYWAIVDVLNLPEMQEMLHMQAKAEVFTALDPAMKGARRRATAGRMDGVRFIAEATRFHNPRVNHEHSGEVKITIDMPRPQREIEGPVVDAEVVD